MGSILMGWLAMVRLCISKRPDMVQSREELEQYYHHEIEKPFMAGWNGEPDTRPPVKRMSSTAFIITILVASIGTYVLLALLRQYVPSLWGG